MSAPTSLHHQHPEGGDCFGPIPDRWDHDPVLTVRDDVGGTMLCVDTSGIGYGLSHSAAGQALCGWAFDRGVERGGRYP